MEGFKAFSVYADFVKDAVFMLIIVNAIGSIGELITRGFTFATTVSTKYHVTVLFKQD